MLRRIISMMLALFMVLSACPVVYMSENEAIETTDESVQNGADMEDTTEDAGTTQDPADESDSLSQNEESEENAEDQETAASDEVNQNPSSNYLKITADAVYHKADITAPEGLAVVEAFVIDQANCDAVQLTLTALPSLSDGETLVFCGLMDDAAEAILENVQVGDTAVVALNTFNGFALMKRLAMVQEANPIEASEEEKNEAAPADPDEVPAEGSNETGNVETADGKSDKSETDANSDNPDPEEEDEEKKDESEDKTETILKKSLEASDGKTYQISVSYSGKASFPEEVELCVSEIAEAEKSYNTFINKAAQAVYLSSTDFSYVRLFDLSILGADGKAYPLDENVSVKIDLLEEADTSDLRVVKIGNRTEEVDADVEDATVSFEADESASVFAIVNVSLFEQEISASMKTAEGTKSGTLYENDDILLTGKMPSMGVVEAEPVSVEIEGQKVLAAYDIKIYANRLMKNLGISWQPSDSAIQVQVKSDVMDKVNTVSVYHIADGESTPELVKEEVAVENGAVSFAAENFSVYVVVDHENGTVVEPRVMFHFIADEPIEHDAGTCTYYEGSPYSFINTAGDSQTTQILRNNESLELIKDPANQATDYFFGWYVVNPYEVSGTTDENGIDAVNSKLYYTWPELPNPVLFETPISISDVKTGGTVDWSFTGNAGDSLSGSGTVDTEGNVHVFLAPLFKKYNFINFMLRPRGTLQSGQAIMTRKMIALGSATSVEVKISDVQSNSTDPVHLIFTGWEYNAGTESAPEWRQITTLDSTGAELKPEGRDGVYQTFSLVDKESIELYPIFIEARWVDFISGSTGSEATYVASQYLHSWGNATPSGTTETEGKNVFTTLDVPTRPGYIFDGWYAFAVMDPSSAITNLTPDHAANVDIKYVNNADHSTNIETVNTQAIQITDGNGTVVYNGTFTLPASGKSLFEGTDGKLKLMDALDRLTLYAKWRPSDTRVTIVYWTENAQDRGFVPSNNVEDTYSANLAVEYNTTDLNELYYAYNGTRPFASGATITYADLEAIGLLETNKLAGAVPAGDEIFYESVPVSGVIGKNSNNDDIHPDDSKIIGGMGNTVFNVYFNRMTFKLVFHIGRDGHVKNGGAQKTATNWDGNWIEFMYKDPEVTALGYPHSGGGRNPQPSYNGTFSMTYDGVTYDSNYVTTNANVMGDYVPADGENVYVITAKFGAYIGDRWPIPGNSNFTFEDWPDPQSDGKYKTLYIWAAYYGSRYAAIANARETMGDANNNNPDINGIYEYMSAELCSNRDGTALINLNRVHHLVAYFGEAANKERFKQYHVLIEAIDGTYDPSAVTLVAGSAFTESNYAETTWSSENSVSSPSGQQYYEKSSSPVISNLRPQYQLGWELEGYDLIYSCYDPVKRNNPSITGQQDYHIYFFYRPKQYTLTFMYESGPETDTYYYTQSLADALAGHDDPVKTGYTFEGWYTNEAGEGTKFDFDTATMPDHSVVLYPKMDLINYMVKIDPHGGIIDHINYSDKATYFNAGYGTPIGAYTIERNYIQLTEREQDPQDQAHYYSGTRYYYVNTQFIDSAIDGDWGLPPSLRNAVYFDETGLNHYYDYYVNEVQSNLDYYTNVTVLSKGEFFATYTSYPEHAYRPVNGESYTFMGWYQVYDNGSVDSMPYNFNDPVRGPITLRAQWRLEGGYYVQYNPYSFEEDTNGNITRVIGDLAQWSDPGNPSLQLYADQSPTHILQAPTPSSITDGWIFRGWRIVRENGTGTYDNNGTPTEYTIWTPIQLDSNGEPIYYQPGDSFIIDSDYATDISGNAKIIHMQAYYEPESSSARRPWVTNLILDANKDYDNGYVDASMSLPALGVPGSTSINEQNHLDASNRPTQILFGDFQSNIAVHLNRYAGFFKHDGDYFLLGFDDVGNEGDYIATYPADGIIAVQRKDQETIYAVWEPMVYVTFVNTTDEDITIDLSSSGTSTVSIINEVTGAFDREAITSQITVPAKTGENNGEVKVVFPKAMAGADEFTATAINDHTGKLMSVSGEYPDGTEYGTNCSDIPDGYVVSYTGVLQKDPNGIVVTYTETDEPKPRVFFDINGGTWNETDQNYEDLTGTGVLYAIEKADIATSHYPPVDPSREDKIFIGWTTNENIAAHSDFSSTSSVNWGEVITPDTGTNILEKVRSDYLYDFSETLPPEGDLTLYAIWSDTVTVTFNIVYSSNVNDVNVKNHSWNGPALHNESQNYEFCCTDENGRFVTYTMAKGEKVPIPNDPTAYSEPTTDEWFFNVWLDNTDGTVNKYRYTVSNLSDASDSNTIVSHTFDFGQPVANNITLVTSWIKSKPQVFTFTIENHVVGGDINDEFTYTIAVTDEWVFGKLGSSNSGSQEGLPDQRWGDWTTTLKNDQSYDVQITVNAITKWKGDYSVRIDVTDSTGTVVKRGHVIYCSRNTAKNYASHYKYKLTISQEPKAGYETTVSAIDTQGTVEDPIVNEVDLSYMFESRMSRPTEPKTSFSPDKNGYVENEKKSTTIIFTNTGSYVPVAPTGVSFRYIPFLIMLMSGILLTVLMFFVYGKQREKKRQ